MRKQNGHFLVICRDDVSAEVYEQKGFVIWGEFFLFFFMFYNICFSWPTRWTITWLLFSFEVDIYHKFWQRVTNEACPYSAYSTIWIYTSHEESLYNWASSEDNRTSTEDKWASSEENWAPSSEDNSTVLCDFRSSWENNWALILVNWSRWRKTKVL